MVRAHDPSTLPWMMPPDSAPGAWPTPFLAEGMRVLPAWIDDNGHMNVAWYVASFDRALDGVYDALGMNLREMIAAGASTFAVEMHISYERELLEGEPLRVTTQFLGFDSKRLHFFQELFQADTGARAATCEWLLLYIDMGARRAAEIPAGLQARLASVRAAHAHLPVPPQVGRGIRLGRPKS
jgi:acyl-CoA thioester hydrolase